jgi:hypothetical protein
MMNIGRGFLRLCAATLGVALATFAAPLIPTAQAKV